MQSTEGEAVCVGLARSLGTAAERCVGMREMGDGPGGGSLGGVGIVSNLGQVDLSERPSKRVTNHVTQK